eukprot:Opistho-1_new@15862
MTPCRASDQAERRAAASLLSRAHALGRRGGLCGPRSVPLLPRRIFGPRRRSGGLVPFLLGPNILGVNWPERPRGGEAPFSSPSASEGKGLRGLCPRSVWSEGDRGKDLGFDHLHAGKRVAHRVGVLLQRAEGAVVAGDDRREIEVAFGGIGGAEHVHGVMPPRAEDADVGFVQVAHPVHVGHDVGVARDIDGVAFARDHEAAFRPDRHVGKARGVAGVDQRRLGAVQGDGAALVVADDLDACGLFEMGGEVVDSDERDVEVLADRGGVCRMVAVAVGEQDVGGATDRLGAAVCGEHRVAREPGVHQQDCGFEFNAEAGVAKPGDLHGVSFVTLWRMF